MNLTPILRSAAFLAAAFLLGGCETLEERVRTTREVQAFPHEFEATSADVMTAATGALARMGYAITSRSAAKGEIEALTDIRRDAGLRSSRQTRIRLTVEDRDGGYSIARLQAWEIREEENTRGERLMSETGVGSPSVANSVFSAVQEFLDQPHR